MSFVTRWTRIALYLASAMSSSLLELLRKHFARRRQPPSPPSPSQLSPTRGPLAFRSAFGRRSTGVGLSHGVAKRRSNTSLKLPSLPTGVAGGTDSPDSPDALRLIEPAAWDLHTCWTRSRLRTVGFPPRGARYLPNICAPRGPTRIRTSTLRARGPYNGSRRCRPWYRSTRSSSKPSTTGMSTYTCSTPRGPPCDIDVAPRNGFVGLPDKLPPTTPCDLTVSIAQVARVRRSVLDFHCQQNFFVRLRRPPRLQLRPQHVFVVLHCFEPNHELVYTPRWRRVPRPSP